MARKLKGLLLGDAMIPAHGFGAAWGKHLDKFGDFIFAGEWESNWDNLQKRRLEVEKNGPEIEPCDPLILKHGKEADVLLGLFVPVSSKVMTEMPDLRIVGVCRAGLENVNVKEATQRGILVFNVMGRNAHAVSDFTVGLMLAECRNIARAHKAILEGQWRKSFSNSDFVPELRNKTIGLVGLGYIGRLVAEKLSGFNVNMVVYDPYADKKDLERAGCKPVSIEELFKESDFVSLHARLTDENRGFINANLINMMKPTAYLINTARAGLIDDKALAEALKKKIIAGAALDVFTTEPIAQDSPYLDLDNVTLTTHIAGTTSEVLANSPFMLAEDISNFLKSGNGEFIVNSEVLDNTDFQNWLAEVRYNQ